MLIDFNITHIIVTINKSISKNFILEKSILMYEMISTIIRVISDVLKIFFILIHNKHYDIIYMSYPQKRGGKNYFPRLLCMYSTIIFVI